VTSVISPLVSASVSGGRPPWRTTPREICASAPAEHPRAVALVVASLLLTGSRLRLGWPSGAGLRFRHFLVSADSARERLVQALSGARRRHLRALGHHLEPVVHCGKEGVSEALIAAANAAIDRHELIKLRLGENAAGDRSDLATAIAEATRADLVAVLGRTVLLYRRHPKKPVIQFPKKTGGPAKTGAPATPVVKDDDVSGAHSDDDTLDDADHAMSYDDDSDE
jgi:RNA-binding protein